MNYVSVSVRRVRRHLLSSAVSIATLSFIAISCSESSSASGVTHGRLAGTVTLVGTSGPANPAGVSISLFASVADYEAMRAAYVQPLLRSPAHPRTYEFAFPAIEPGAYYVLACVDFGCGEYRYPGSSLLRVVVVDAGQSVVLNFGL